MMWLRRKEDTTPAADMPLQRLRLPLAAALIDAASAAIDYYACADAVCRVAAAGGLRHADTSHVTPFS